MTPRPRTNRPRRFFIALAYALLGAALPALHACEGPAALVYLFTGKDKQPALYELDPEAQTLIWIEDNEQLFTEPNAAIRIAAVAGAQLLAEGALDQPTLDNHALVTASDQDLQGKDLPQIARAYHAEQFIYARVAKVSAGATASLARPQALLEVRVIDAATGATVFPPSNPGNAQLDQGYPLRVDMPAAYEPGDGRASRNRLEDKLAEEAGVHLARLFHTWSEPEVGEVFR
ncbi:MAG: hypothetical protein AAF288_01800 [Planctomycetota bacterium]